MEKERLDKLIAANTDYSRSEIKKAAKKGRVSLDGETVKDLSFKADPDSCEISIDGETVKIKKYVYIMLNKPEGVISASDGKGDKTVIDILPDDLKRDGLFPAGRLDRQTTGFVLITNDGEFAHDILSPRHHVKKNYNVKVDKAPSESELDILRQGITLKDGTHFKPASIEFTDKSENTLSVTITEGKYHQIKRMFKAVGSEVVKLHRTSIGNLKLDETLDKGQARYLSEQELLLIKEIND